MTKASIELQDLRRRLYVKAKAETAWRFWGLYVHVCKMETLREAYALAKNNDGAPGVDGVTFAAIEAQGVAAFLEQLQDELVRRTYVPLPAAAALLRRLDPEQAADRQQPLGLLVDHVGKGSVALVGIAAHRMLKRGDGLRGPDMILAANAIGAFAADIERIAVHGRIAEGSR
jgi:hypothetical protein